MNVVVNNQAPGAIITASHDAGNLKITLWEDPTKRQPVCPIAGCGKELREDVKDFAQGVPCEVSFVCPEHGEVGYFAYGHYDPAYEFQG